MRDLFLTGVKFLFGMVNNPDYRGIQDLGNSLLVQTRSETRAKMFAIWHYAGISTPVFLISITKGFPDSKSL